MESYDYVIVGGGSAGCVVANRLSEDGDASVLVLESGGRATRPEIGHPGSWVALLGSDLDWGYRTLPQDDAAGRQIPWPRGRVLGGSSSLNAMVFMRGRASDYDAWAAAGNHGWDYASVLPSFRALEDFPDGDPEQRGQGGPLKVRLPTRCHPLSEAARAAAIDWGNRWSDDLNGHGADGVGWNQLTVADGLRQSSAVAFLEPALGRPSLTMRTEAHAMRLVLDDAHRVVAVDYVHGGHVERVGVAREAIVCAGTLESPKLLMLSGIGPADHLRELGVDVAVDLPGVGSNLHDHPGIGITFEVARPIPPGNNQYSELGIFCRTDPALAEPDVQYGVLHVPVVSDGFEAPANSFTLYPSCLKPRSRGVLRLRSTSTFDAPLANPNYLREEEDRRVLLRAIEISRELARGAGLRDWVREEAVPGERVGGDRALRDYLAQAVNTWFHPVGTCKMGVDADAVVDPELRVHGVEGLRVADASVIPEVTAGNTNAPTLMIGWKAADLVRAAVAA